MEYSAELNFLRKSLSACRIQNLILHPDEDISHQLDLGLRSLIGWEQDPIIPLPRAFRVIADHTLFRLTDGFGCQYLFFRLPDREEVLWIGPYFTAEMTQTRLMEIGEQYHVPPHRFQQLTRLCSEFPLVPEDSPVFTFIHTFCSLVFGGVQGYALEDVSQEFSKHFSPLPPKTAEPAGEDILLTMKVMENRYRFENQLMDAVTQGLSHKGEVMLSHLTSLSLEQRGPDSGRSMKNYCIIMNTLLRKAAERGGVHPLYLDRTSTQYALRIEQVTANEEVTELMHDMFHSYCRLVKRHSTRQYSLPVRRAVTYIDSDLTADLSLRALAAAQDLSPGYLSTVFKRETGQTVTEYVNRQRMLHAIRLLSTTRLQIQTIARHCGIPDVNYFSKLFKKHTGKTPKEFRKDTAGA